MCGCTYNCLCEYFPDIHSACCRGVKQTRSKLSTSLESRLLVGCLTSQQHARVSQGRICSDSCTCCHTEKEVADQTCCFIQPRYTVTGLTSSSPDLVSPGQAPGRIVTRVPTLVTDRTRPDLNTKQRNKQNNTNNNNNNNSNTTTTTTSKPAIKQRSKPESGVGTQTCRSRDASLRRLLFTGR